MRIFGVALLCCCLAACSHVGTSSSDAVTVIKDKRNRPDTVVMRMPVGHFTLKVDTPMDKPEFKRGELHPDAPLYRTYMELVNQGVLAVVSSSATRQSQLDSMFKNLSGIKGEITFGVGPKGAQYICGESELRKAAQEYNNRFRQFVCWPFNDDWAVDKVVDDQVLQKGGEKYRWIRYVATSSLNDPFTAAWVKANGWNTRTFKESSVYRLDPFSNQWKQMHELDEYVPVDQDFKENKAAAFFGQSAKGLGQ